MELESKYNNLDRSSHMKSFNQEYETPDELYNMLHDEFHFECDLAASEQIHKHENYYSIENNAFSYNWLGVNWLNCEWKNVGKWTKRAFEQNEKFNSTVVMLMMVKSNTNWWRDCVMQAKEVRFINQKLQFKNTEPGLRFPTCIVVFQPHFEKTKFSVLEIPK